MPTKYIHIKCLYARTPFPNPRLHHVIKRRQTPTPAHSQVPLTRQTITHSPDEFIQINYNRAQLDELGLYLLVVSREDRVASLGYVALSLGERVQEKKEYLKGVAQQNGYVIYSMRDTPFQEQEQRKYGGELPDYSPQSLDKASRKGERSVDASSVVQPGYQHPRHPLTTQFSPVSNKNNQRNLNLSHTQKRYQNVHPLPGQDSKLQISNAKSEILQQNNQNIGKVTANRGAIGYNPHPSQGYKSGTSKLLMHKQQNASYRKGLLAMQQQYKLKQERLRELGILGER